MAAEGYPDFYIVGAPKCGTTSLYHYLRGHPRIFLPALKEPMFFCSDLPEIRRTTAAGDYLRLFGAAPAGTRTGEASAWYLFSEAAIPAILARNPGARFIALVRSPVEMAPSLHGELVYGLKEDILEFERAWRAQRARRDVPRHLDYGEVCRLGAQVRRLFDLVEPPNRKVVLLDDLARSPRAVYAEILAFLGVPDDGRAGFPRHNVSRAYWSMTVARLVRRPPPPLDGCKSAVKRCVAAVVDRPVDLYARLLTRRSPRPPLGGALRAELVEYFSDDIELLADTLGRDLGHWRRSRPADARAAAPRPVVTPGRGGGAA